jgi:hypothetical protein
MLHDGGLPVSRLFGILAARAFGGDDGWHGQAEEDYCEGGAEMSNHAAIAVLVELIEADLQEAWAALDAGLFAAAKTALDRAKGKVDLISDLKPGDASVPEQLTIDVSTEQHE